MRLSHTNAAFSSIQFFALVFKLLIAHIVKLFLLCDPLDLQHYECCCR